MLQKAHDFGHSSSVFTYWCIHNATITWKFVEYPLLQQGSEDSVYRIGPFDVESCLIEHPAVVESAVVGKPDAERGEIVAAFVVLRPGQAASPELAHDLQQFTRERLSAHAYPREVLFVDDLPKTPSGKIQRYVLRQRVS